MDIGFEGSRIEYLSAHNLSLWTDASLDLRFATNGYLTFKYKGVVLWMTMAKLIWGRLLSEKSNVRKGLLNEFKLILKPY